MLLFLFFGFVSSSRRASRMSRRKKIWLVSQLHIVILKGPKIILKAKLKSFMVIIWRFFNFYIFCWKKIARFLPWIELFTKKECSNVTDNIFIQLPTLKNMGIDTKRVKKASGIAEMWLFLMYRNGHKLKVAKVATNQSKLSCSPHSFCCSF